MDISTIENFDSMDAQTLRDFIKGYEVPEDLSDKYSALKESFNKTSSELADAKKTLRSKLSADEAEKADREAREKEREELIQTLLREKTVNSYAKSLVEIGIDSSSAVRAAEALPDDVKPEFFESIKNLIKNREKEIRAEITKGSPRPDDAGGSGVLTAEEILKIKNPAERRKAIADNIELFGEF